MAAASPLLQLGLLHMRPIQFWLKQRVPAAAWRHGCHRVMVTQTCVSALTHWRNPLWLKQGMTLDTAHKRKVVMTDASNKGWGALCEGKLTFGLWFEEESTLHINSLEMLAVCLACQFFLPDIRGHNVLVRSDSSSVPTILRVLKGPPFEPLQSLSLRAAEICPAVSIGVGDLQALSINPACQEFGPNDSKVILNPRLGYVPKVLSTPFRAQVIALSTFLPQWAARNHCSARQAPENLC